MPEGDTIFRLATKLRTVLEGQTIVAAQGSESFAKANALLDTDVAGVESRGKHLLIHFSGGQVLHSHLGMNGSWQVYRLTESWHRPAWQVAVVLTTRRHHVVCFQPKVLELLSAKALLRHRWLSRLGPDLLGPEIDDSTIVARCRDQNGVSAGEAVMNQAVVCGIGNIYKSEILFSERVNPRTKISELADDQIVALIRLAARLLRKNLTGRKRRTRFRSTGPSVWVYGRSGEPCLKCDSTVEMIRQGPLARSTYFCPECQRAENNDNRLS